MRRRLTTGLLALAFSGIAIASDDAYWQDQSWNESLFNAVQGSIHYPADDPDQSVQSANATVTFTYADGKIEGLKLAQSSGHPELDAAILKQVMEAQVPKAIGSRASEPHIFTLDLTMPTPFDAFLKADVQAINAKRFYPRGAILNGSQGIVTVGFDYQDGDASNLEIIDASHDHNLNEAALRAVQSAKLPPAPPGYVGKKIHLKISVCYSLGGNRCPVTQQVIQVVNTP